MNIKGMTLADIGSISDLVDLNIADKVFVQITDLPDNKVAYRYARLGSEDGERYKNKVILYTDIEDNNEYKRVTLSSLIDNIAEKEYIYIDKINYLKGIPDDIIVSAGYKCLDFETNENHYLIPKFACDSIDADAGISINDGIIDVYLRGTSHYLFPMNKLNKIVFVNRSMHVSPSNKISQNISLSTDMSVEDVNSISIIHNEDGSTIFTFEFEKDNKKAYINAYIPNTYLFEFKKGDFPIEVIHI